MSWQNWYYAAQLTRMARDEVSSAARAPAPKPLSYDLVPGQKALCAVIGGVSVVGLVAAMASGTASWVLFALCGITAWHISVGTTPEKREVFRGWLILGVIAGAILYTQVDTALYATPFGELRRSPWFSPGHLGYLICWAILVGTTLASTLLAVEALARGGRVVGWGLIILTVFGCAPAGHGGWIAGAGLLLAAMPPRAAAPWQPGMVAVLGGAVGSVLYAVIDWARAPAGLLQATF